jgi:hypothetical protein
MSCREARAPRRSTTSAIWMTGLEMLGLGMVVALVAFGAGALAASLASALA